MSTVSRRTLLTGIGVAAGGGGLAVAARLARQYGLIPPDGGGVYGPGETLTYAAHRILGAHAPARGFRRDQISKEPFANEVEPPLTDAFKRLQAGSFTDWRLQVDGMVARPAALSLDDVKRMPRSSQITSIQCEEGWSYVAEWSGVPLAHVLDLAGAAPQARYVVYRSFQPDWWESIDMADALHPQTIVAHGMNGADVPVPFGGPLRLRVPRQLGYKSIKYLARLTVTDSLKGFGKGKGGAASDFGYAWYAGI